MDNNFLQYLLMPLKIQGPYEMQAGVRMSHTDVTMLHMPIQVYLVFLQNVSHSALVVFTPLVWHSWSFWQKRARKICNTCCNCGHMCLKITKIILVSFLKFSCEMKFIVIFVIVKHNLKICCGFLIIYGLVVAKMT